MPKSLGEQLDEKGWQAGSVVPPALHPELAPYLQRHGKEAPIFDDADWLVVISQTCDVVHPDIEKEPLVELLHCRATAKLRPEFRGQKSTRQLDFQPNPSTHPEIYLTAHAVADRYVVPRNLLAAHNPNADRTLSDRAVSNLQQWYALRYTRPAWPNSFVERIEKDVKKRLITALKKIQIDDIEVRVAIQEKDVELPEGETYHVIVFFVVDQNQWDSNPEVRELAYLSHAEFVGALNSCNGIEVNVDLSGVKCGDEFTWQSTRTTDEWNFANLSTHE